MLFRQSPTRKKARHAVAASELVIVAPVFVFILLASADFARLYLDYITITNCARNGALYGSNSAHYRVGDADHSSDSSGIQTAALADSTYMSATPTVASSLGTDADGNACVTVTVSSTFTTLISYPGMPSSMSLSRTVQMRVIDSTPANPGP